ncbi:MAG: 30S ribosome-binding factor RbfA [Cyanobacteria bacterium MAG APA_bin_95]|uniref:Ribosome-binding factor A n=1 Tax=Candidatus Synechococcus spongiarum LMB bulk15M TaxID=1943582 RepID=A0A1T1CZU9_9SYNE|nr:30S ribosome-binding factor RbfA [Cyanobacteria bacterium MAG APA_bin_95]OOV34094.1 ribosome-binding factor A [Candidatus Synechococcus spongiarum LMB bulk15M]
MAQGRRVTRVAALIKRELGRMLSGQLGDERLTRSIISITAVEVSGDLQNCKVFVSLYGEEAGQEAAFNGLEAASGFLRSQLSRRLELRRCPKLRFYQDKGMEAATTVLSLLETLQQGKPSVGPG